MSSAPSDSAAAFADSRILTKKGLESVLVTTPILMASPPPEPPLPEPPLQAVKIMEPAMTAAPSATILLDRLNISGLPWPL